MQQGNKVVLDTNIIISAAISTDGVPARIFELFLEKKIVNYTSEEIVKEVEEVINRPFFRKYIDDEYKKFVLENFKLHSVMIKPSFDEKAVPDDKGDNKFINCALTIKADIISGDKHLLDIGNYKGIKVFSARQFLDGFEEK